MSLNRPRLLTRVIGVWAAPLMLAVLRLTGRRAGIVLVYHAIEPVGRYQDRALVPPVDGSDFVAQLQHLRRLYDIVPAHEFLEAVAGRRRGRRFPVCLTFDDDLRQHLAHAVPILEAENAPGMFFLCGTSLMEARSTWWERLQRALDRGYAPADFINLLPPVVAARLRRNTLDIQQVAEAIEHLGPSERDAVAERLLTLAGSDPPHAGLSEGEIGSLAHARGTRIGFHTRRHDPLTPLDHERLNRAMSDGRDRIAAICGQPLDAIAYPHGSADARVADAARSAGFQFGFTARRCAVTPSSNPLLLGRCDAASIGGSAGAFALGVVKTLMIGDEHRRQRR